MDVIQSEKDANNDYLYGEGWSAKQRARQAEANAAYEAAIVKREQWELDHPEEFAAEQKAYMEALERENRKDEKAARRRAKQPIRYTATKQYKGDYAAYREGYNKGDEIGLDQQVDSKAKPRLS